MEACIEALFTIDGEADKRKTHEMIRVLKGAISVSKSRTGEVIYHFNRHEKKALSRTMAKCDRDSVRSRVNIDNQKRDVLRKWNMVFGRQRKFTESIRGFNDMLHEALDSRHLLKLSGEDGDEEEEARAAAEAAREMEEKRRKDSEAKKMPKITDPRARRLGGRQTAPPGVVSTPVMVGVLPKLNGGSLHGATEVETAAEKRLRKEREAEEERRMKAKELPRFDKELMETYLSEQKSLHEDLLTRNALIKIKSSVDKDHDFFTYRLKTRLPDSALSLLQQLERERSFSAMTSCTRPSTRARSRLSTRHSTRRPGPSRGSPRSSREEEGRAGEGEVAAHRGSLTARPASPSLLSEAAAVFPKLDRSKTVHFC